MSESQQNQILSHTHFKTFLKHYLSQHIIVDVQATFLGHNSMLDLIKEIGKLCLCRDPNLPRRLTDSQQALAHRHPDIIRAEQARVEVKKRIASAHSSMKQAAGSLDGIEYGQLCRQIRVMKQRAERAVLDKALRDYHSTADLNHMVVQLMGEEPASQILTLVEHTIADCNWLADNLFDPVTDESFTNIVETMSRLCSQLEGKGRRDVSGPGDDTNPFTHGSGPGDGLSKPRLVPDADIQPTQPCVGAASPAHCDRAITAATAVTTAKAAVPHTVRQAQKRLTMRTCLFCFGNPQRSRAQRFPTTASLRNHYCMIHFQYQIDTFLCPVPSCDKIVLDPNHFANHAVTVHKSDLGVRASIMKVQKHSVKPGTLIPFRL